MSATDKIIERVQKLLALAGNNPNENEAAAAIEKAHAILVEHNLGMMEVQLHKGRDAADEERGSLNIETNFSESYYADIWSTVAEVHFCKHLYLRPNPRKRMTVRMMVGRKINTMVASQLAVYLCETMRRLSNQAARDAGRSDFAFKNAFLTGCAARLVSRIRDLKPKGEANALVLWTGDEDAKNQSFIDETIGKVRQARSVAKSTFDRDGLRAGYKAGEDISLNQQIAGDAEEAKRLASTGGCDA